MSERSRVALPPPPLPAAPEPRPTPARTTGDAPVFVTTVAALSLAAAGIHFAVIPSRFAEAPIFGVFFSALAWGQTLWTVAFMRRRTTAVLLIGASGATAVVVVWAWARAFGLPLGPTAGVPLRPSFAGVVATGLEAVVALLCGVRSVRSNLGTSLDRRVGALLIGAVIIVVVVLTTAAMAAGDATTT